MKAWRDLKGMPRGVWVLFATTLVNRAGTMVLPFLVLYLTRDLGFTAGQAGAVLFVYGVGAFISAALSGRLSDALGPMHSFATLCSRAASSCFSSRSRGRTRRSSR